MTFTDVFIKKPVLASVISVLILVLGFRSMFGMPVRQYPETQNASVTVTTAYFGAAPDVVAGFITAPIEEAVAQAQGIDYLSSSSYSGVSTVTATLKLNYDSNRALSEINTKVQSVLNRLPPQAQQPVLTVQVGEQIASMYMGFNSGTLPTNKITDYVLRVVQPRLQTIQGVKQAELLGGRQFALRAWMDPARMASVGVTAEDIYGALQANNYLSALGTTKGQMVSIDLTAGTDLHSLDDFKQLVVKREGDSLVRLQDVANVTLGATEYDSATRFDGKQSVFIGVRVAPDANVLTVIQNVRKEFPGILDALPEGLHGEIVYDATEYIDASITEVEKTLVEALLIVAVVIFLFLGTMRSVLIPVIAMPLSLIGAFFVMLLLGYSINLLTLLALVLAIGLVVDDAIIVVENIDRHIKMGKTPFEAALVGARELAGPVIAISVVLIAVYVPIGFQGGLTGVLFSEFAFTLAGAVAVSAVVALTLSPAMCALFLRDGHHSSKLVEMIDRNFEWFSSRYRRLLDSMLGSWGLVVAFGVFIFLLVLAFFLLPSNAGGIKRELAPEEDQGFLFHLLSGPPNATNQQMTQYSKQTFETMKSLPEYNHAFQIDGAGAVNSGFGGINLKAYEDRSRGTAAIQQELQAKANSIAGANVFWINPPSLPGGGGGFPIQFVISTTDSFSNLYQVAEEVVARAQATGRFYVLDNGLKIDKPQTTVQIDRDKVAALGLDMSQVGGSLSAMLGGGYVNYFSMAGRSYQVIPQVEQQSRLNAEQLGSYYLRAANGEMIPASTVISFKTETAPQSITRFQQLNSATIGGVFGGTQGDALELLGGIAKDVLPAGYTIDYGGESRQFVTESGGFIVTLAFALVIIYLTLAAQFESFRDPLVVMMSVPMAIFGAGVFLFIGYEGLSLNVYTQVGLVTLVGLIAKHGILIVQFANELQEAGRSKLEAISEGASIRLRPILMTTAAMALGVLPLVIADGAGAVGRNHMGLVIFTGISIGTLFTLFVVPAMYMLLARDHYREAAERTAQATTAVPLDHRAV